MQHSDQMDAMRAAAWSIMTHVPSKERGDLVLWRLLTLVGMQQVDGHLSTAASMHGRWSRAGGREWIRAKVYHKMKLTSTVPQWTSCRLKRFILTCMPDHSGERVKAFTSWEDAV